MTTIQQEASNVQLLRIRRARTQLILREPFFGAVAMGWDVFAHPPIGTMGTDGVSLAFNPAFVESKSIDELRVILAHEAGHVVGFHNLRRGNRDHGEFNVACDYAVNDLLKRSGYTIPEGGLWEERFSGMDAESIYDAMQQEKQDAQDEQKPDESGNEGDDEPDDDDSDDTSDADQDEDSGDDEGDGDDDEGQESEGDGDDEDDESDEESEPSNASGSGEGDDDESPADTWPEFTDKSCMGKVFDRPCDGPASRSFEEAKQLQEIVSAMEIAKSQGNMPGAFEELIDGEVEPQVAWYDKIRPTLAGYVAKDDYSYVRQHPSHRRAGGPRMPSLYSPACGDLVISVDTSQSMSPPELEVARAEIQCVRNEVKPERTIVIWCDTRIQRVDTFGPYDELEFNAPGRGGTSLVPPFEYIAENCEQIECHIYITDGFGDFPEEAPTYPVIWISTEADTDHYPFGDVIEVNPEGKRIAA